jgi:hypothetical protein
MTKALIKFIPNKFADESYEVEVEPCSFYEAIELFKVEHPKQGKPIHGKKVMVFLNGERLVGELFKETELKAGDVIEITNTIEGDVLDFIWTGLTWGWAWLDFFDFDFEMDETESTQTYEWDGPTTQTRQGGVVPVVYGMHGVGGTYVNFNIWSDGEENYADMLVALCEGEIGGIRDEDNTANASIPTNLEDVDTATPWIKLNDQMITEYEDAYWAGRVGTNSQTSIQGFRDIQTLYDYDYKVPAERDNPGGNWTLLYTTNAAVDSFVIKMQADALYNYNSKGKMRANSVKYRVRYRVDNPEGSWVYDPVVSGSVDSADSWYTVSAKSQSPTKANLTVQPAAGRNTYDLQVQRYDPATTANDAANPFKTLQITEVVSEDLAYPNTVILAIRVKATDQLSGSFPEVLTLVQGRKVRVPDLGVGNGGTGTLEFEDYYWTGTGNNFRKIVGDTLATWDGTSYITQYTSNPAYCIRDYMLSTRFGVGDIMVDASLDNTAIDNAAKRCWQLSGTKHKSELHMVIDTQGSPVDALKQMGLVSRIFIFWAGGYIKFKYLEDEDPVQLITMGNILEGKFNTTYVNQSTIPNILEVRYANAEDNWKESSKEIVDEAEWALNKPQRRKTIELRGVTDTAQAIREAKYHLNLATYRRRSVSLTTTVESLHCEPGDIVAVQHDVPQWGWGGRVLTNSTSTTVVIDQEIPAAIVSDPTAYDVKVIHGTDDTIETKDILSVSGKTVTIDGTWTTTPAEDDTYILGVVDSSIKEYRVQGMTVNEDDSIAMKLEEHSASIYSDTGYVASDDEASTLPNPAAFAPVVENLTLYELHNEVGMGVSYQQPADTYVYDHADIYLSTDDIQYIKVAEGYGSDDVEVTGLMPGIKYYVKVYSINKIGIKNNDPAESTLTLTGATIGEPATPTGLEIDDGGVGQGLTTTFAGRDCKVRWNLNAPYGGAGSLEPQEPAGIAGMDWAVVRDFKVEVWNATGDIRIREEFTTDKFYTYTYAKNFEDSGGVPRRTFQFKIYQRNWFSLLSKLPAILTVSNPAPSMATHTPSLQSVYRGARVDFTSYVITDNDMDYFKLYYGYNSTPLTGSVDNINWRNQTHTIGGLSQLTKVYVRIKPYDAFGAGTQSVVASVRTQGFDFVNASDNEWTMKADAVVASIIKNTTITASKMGIASLSAISANIGNINAGYIEGVVITGGLFQTSTSGKRIQITDQGLSLSVTDAVGGYGEIRYGDNPASNASVFFGSGSLAYIHHLSEAVPFYIAAEQTVGDFHFYPRSSDPTGLGEIGDVCVVNASLKICTAGGTPGTWTVVGVQTG